MNLKNNSTNWAKENKCPNCEGLGYILIPAGACNNDEDEKHPCYCDDGTYVGHLETMIQIEANQASHRNREYNELAEWAKRTSNCKTCEGDRNKTFGLCTCSECGIPGMGVWPG